MTNVFYIEEDVSVFGEGQKDPMFDTWAPDGLPADAHLTAPHGGVKKVVGWKVYQGEDKPYLDTLDAPKATFRITGVIPLVPVTDNTVTLQVEILAPITK